MRKSLFQAAAAPKVFRFMIFKRCGKINWQSQKKKGAKASDTPKKGSVLREIFVLFLQGKSKFSSFKKYLQYKFVLYIRKIRKNL